MYHYLLKISYDGKEFHGVVPQVGIKTVIGDILNFVGAGRCKYSVVSRTDKGVSAEENYVVLSLPFKVKWDEFEHQNIKIRKVFLLNEFVNIRKLSKGKLYHYYLPKSLFDEKYIFKPKYIIIDDFKIEIKWKDCEFDIIKYKEASKKFVGKHNFFNFAKGRVANSVCKITKFNVLENKDFWLNEIEGNRFLYEMIRRIISFLVSVGKCRFPLDKIDLILDKAKLEPKPPAAPPEYLVLKRVYLDWQKLYKCIKEVVL